MDDEAIKQKRAKMHRRVHGAVTEAMNAVLGSRFPMVGAVIILTDEKGQTWSNAIISSNPLDGALLYARASSAAETVRKHIDNMREEYTTELEGRDDLEGDGMKDACDECGREQIIAGSFNWYEDSNRVLCPDCSPRAP